MGKPSQIHIWKEYPKVGFFRYNDLIECSAAKWMQKMIFTLEPTMMTELIKFPRSRSICKISPLTKPNSTRFKRTAVNSVISCFNKVDNSLTSLAPGKFKKGIK